MYKNNLYQRRIELNKPQIKILQEIGVGRTTYYSYEKGTHLPTVLVAMKIAKSLDTTVDQLWAT